MRRPRQRLPTHHYQPARHTEFPSNKWPLAVAVTLAVCAVLTIAGTEVIEYVIENGLTDIRSALVLTGIALLAFFIERAFEPKHSLRRYKADEPDYTELPSVRLWVRYLMGRDTSR